MAMSAGWRGPLEVFALGHSAFLHEGMFAKTDSKMANGVHDVELKQLLDLSMKSIDRKVICNCFAIRLIMVWFPLSKCEGCSLFSVLHNNNCLSSLDWTKQDIQCHHMGFRIHFIDPTNT